jgi:hypothetical protein
MSLRRLIIILTVLEISITRPLRIKLLRSVGVMISDLFRVLGHFVCLRRLFLES